MYQFHSANANCVPISSSVRQDFCVTSCLPITYSPDFSLSAIGILSGGPVGVPIAHIASMEINYEYINQIWEIIYRKLHKKHTLFKLKKKFALTPRRERQKLNLQAAGLSAWKVRSSHCKSQMKGNFMRS